MCWRGTYWRATYWRATYLVEFLQHLGLVAVHHLFVGLLGLLKDKNKIKTASHVPLAMASISVSRSAGMCFFSRKNTQSSAVCREQREVCVSGLGYVTYRFMQQCPEDGYVERVSKGLRGEGQ